MSANIDLKKIWNTYQEPIPEVKNLFEKANRFKRKGLYKLIILNVLLIVTFIFMGFIWYYYQPRLWTTKIGFVLTFAALVLAIAFNNTTIPLLLSSSIESNSKNYLQQLIKLRKKQLFLHTTILSIYFLLLSIGIGFYMFEHILKMTLLWRVFAYGITLIWILINWFYFRPKIISKQQAKMNKLITDFEELREQFIL